MSNRIPIPLEVWELAYLEKLTICIESGRVLNSKGDEIGSINGGGRFQIGINAGGKQRNRRRHHIIWWKATGEWPIFELDHIDRDRKNDRITNLRPSTPGQNNKNVTKKSGLPVGVVAYPRVGGRIAYIAQISIKGKMKWLGSHTTVEDAARAYQEAWCKAHPDGY